MYNVRYTTIVVKAKGKIWTPHSVSVHHSWLSLQMSRQNNTYKQNTLLHGIYFPFCLLFVARHFNDWISFSNFTLVRYNGIFMSKRQSFIIVLRSQVKVFSHSPIATAMRIQYWNESQWNYKVANWQRCDWILICWDPFKLNDTRPYQDRGN